MIEIALGLAVIAGLLVAAFLIYLLFQLLDRILGIDAEGLFLGVILVITIGIIAYSIGSLVRY